jgi:FecR-like protein
VGGHVHFRFVDGGRLSIRPSSRLQVESYNHSSQEPALTAIKFRLDEGVVRSITGAWGEAARDRFRLNTPVAAIGVKGTDFVVRSDADKTSASVYTGAIVLSPLTAGCEATLGPCQSGMEKLLSADMKGQMLELNRQQSSPQLVPLVDLLAQNRRLAPGSESARAEKTVVTDASRQDIASDKAVVTEARSAGVVAAGSTPPPPLVVAPPPGPPEVTQLVWGRWDWTAPAGDTLSRTFQEAMQNGRFGTVGNGAYGLYRVASDPNALLQTSDASANFRLAGGAAQFFMPERAPELARVDGGSLSVDFSRATFATQLNVSSQTIGANTLQADGTVTRNGLMLGQGGNAFVAGALSLDGKEAGYFFEKAFPAGNLSGITLWGR